MDDRDRGVIFAWGKVREGVVDAEPPHGTTSGQPKSTLQSTLKTHATAPLKKTASRF